MELRSTPHTAGTYSPTTKIKIQQHLQNLLLPDYCLSLTADIQQSITELRHMQAALKEERATASIKKFRRRLSTQARQTHRYIFSPENYTHTHCPTGCILKHT